MKQANRTVYGVLFVVTLLLVFVTNGWAESPDKIKFGGPFFNFEKEWQSNLVLEDGSTLNATNSAFMYLSPAENPGEWNLHFEQVTSGNRFLPSPPYFQLVFLMTYGEGIITDDYLSITMSPNNKEAYVEIDTDALPMSDPLLPFIKFQTPPQDGLQIPFGLIALSFEWTNELKSVKEDHSNLEYEDRFVQENVQSQHNGAYVDGTFLDQEIFPVTYGVPQGQLGKIQTTRIIQYK